MGSLLSIIIIVGAFYFVIIKSLKKNASAKGKVPGVKPVSARAGKAARPQGFTNYRPHKDIVSVSRDMGDKGGNSVLRDDKANDWLARQLREEHRAFKATSEMFDLKIEHASHCDAKLLEQFHRRNCTASGIDLANGSMLRK